MRPYRTDALAGEGDDPPRRPPSNDPSRRNVPRRPAPVRRALHALRVILPAGLLILTFGLLAAERHLEAFCDSPFPVGAPAPYHPALVAVSPFPSVASRVAEGAAVPVEYRFERGDTLGAVLQELGLAPEDATAATLALAEHLDPRRVRAGQRLSVMVGPDSRATALRFELDGRGRVVLARDSGGWSSSWQEFERTVHTRSVSGVLEGSLEASMRQAGADPRVTLRMADVLQWDLDFNRDLRRGDRFEVIYEEIYLDGRPYGPGNVLALSYENGGRQLDAYRYGDGYYDAEGRPLEKMFLRSPLAYSRVTSRFSLKRFHPVLKTYRPHYGVDYGAPIGTPVRVTAGGVVEFAGWSRGGGKTVKVRHPNGFLTAYLHLSRFGDGIAPGRRVRQGDVIAFTGNTGLSSGPHLDYRVQRNGRWIDPLSLKNLPADPIPTTELAQFMAWRDACRRSFASGQPLPAGPAAGARIALASSAGGDAAADPTPSIAGR